MVPKSKFVSQSPVFIGIGETLEGERETLEGYLQEEGLHHLHDRRVELVDLLSRLGQDRHTEAARPAQLNGRRLHAVRQADVDTVLLEQEIQKLGAQGVRGRHVVLGDGADVAGSGDDQGREGGAVGALHGLVGALPDGPLFTRL